LIDDTITAGNTVTTWSSSRINTQLNARAMRSGDLGGAATLTTVIGLQGRGVMPDVPEQGFVLSFDETDDAWRPMLALLGGRPVDGVAPNNNEVLTWQSSPAPGAWRPRPAAPISASNDIVYAQRNGVLWNIDRSVSGERRIFTGTIITTPSRYINIGMLAEVSLFSGMEIVFTGVDNPVGTNVTLNINATTTLRSLFRRDQVANTNVQFNDFKAGHTYTFRFLMGSTTWGGASGAWYFVGSSEDTPALRAWTDAEITSRISTAIGILFDGSF
jgi:hypothetical protein